MVFILLRLLYLNKEGEVLAESQPGNPSFLDIRYKEYEPGDKIKIIVEGQRPDNVIDIVVQFDNTMAPSIVRIPTGEYTFTIPFDTEREPYGQNAFCGDTHLIYARLLEPFEYRNIQNLATNAIDYDDQDYIHPSQKKALIYPHIWTNSGATNVRFLAKNANNGNCNNVHHGRFPYESWGTNGRDDAELTLDLGKTIYCHSINLYFRHDFPHDTYWKSLELVIITEEDGKLSEHIHPVTDIIKDVTYTPVFLDQKLRAVRLQNMVRADDEPPFAALSQIVVWGALEH